MQRLSHFVLALSVLAPTSALAGATGRVASLAGTYRTASGDGQATVTYAGKGKILVSLDEARPYRRPAGTLTGAASIRKGEGILRDAYGRFRIQIGFKDGIMTAKSASKGAPTTRFLKAD